MNGIDIARGTSENADHDVHPIKNAYGHWFAYCETCGKDVGRSTPSLTRAQLDADAHLGPVEDVPQ